MAYIYAYAPEETECASIGLVGALLDQDACFELRAGEFGELSFTHPMDPWGKWRVLEDGVILKTMVPVRLVPEVDDGAYVESVDVYTVARTATKYQRYIYYASTSEKDPKEKTSKGQRTKHKKLLKRGATVTVLADPRPGDSSYRYKVRVGSGKKRVTGYMEKAGLTLKQASVPVAPTQEGLEADAPSYAIQQQLFRIYEVETEADGGNPGSVTVRARRLVYDLLGNICTYRATTNVSCQQVCEEILAHTVFSHPFTIFSDIGDRHVGIDVRDMNPVAAIIDPDEGVVAHWGGEVICDDYDVYLLRRAGLDRGVRIKHGGRMADSGVVIRYGKDLAGVSCRLDSSNVATAIRPVGETASGESLYLDGHVINGRHGYNYNSSTHTCSDWLPEGYRFAVDDDGSQTTTLIERDQESDGYATPKAISLRVSDAKVTKKNKSTSDSETSVLTTALARVMLAEAAVEQFDNGCDVPDISMDVDFTQLGDSEEYAQYRHLEPLFVYDTVIISHPRARVKAQVSLTSLEWQVRAERVSAATFGSLGDAVASIPGWQISGISGGKIAPGSVNSGQISADAIATEHLQAESVNTEALQAESVTADKIAAAAIKTISIEAVSAVIDDIEAGTVTTGTLAAELARMHQAVADRILADIATIDDLTAAIVRSQQVTARTADFDVETVTHLVGSLMDVTRLFGQFARINNLYVTEANLANATLDRLTVLGQDGSYYDISVGSDGVVHASEREVSQAEADAGETDDGRGIVDTAIDIEEIDERTMVDAETGLATLYVAALSAGRITATEAFLGSARIPSIEATTINAIGENMNLRANRSIQLELGAAGDVQRWITFDNEHGMTTRRPAWDETVTEGGVETVVHHEASSWSTQVDEQGFSVNHLEVVGHVGTFEKEGLVARSLTVQRDPNKQAVSVRQTTKGGWSWKAR